MAHHELGHDMVSTGVTISSTVETAILGPGGVGIYRDLRKLIITNRSTSVSTLVTISCSSGSNSSGFKYTIAERGGISLTYAPDLLQTTPNASWCATVSPSATVDIVVSAIEKSTEAPS